VTSEVSGRLLRQARRRAGLSQAELGRRAGVTQSVVSAYESGARQPALPTLERLVRAAGFELDMTIHGPKSAPPRTGETAGERLRRHRRQVCDIAARYGLSNVRVFGSVARDEDTVGSDVDLLVDVAPEVGLIGLARCERDLEVLLGMPVDLVPAAGLKAGVTASALAEARPL